MAIAILYHCLLCYKLLDHISIMYYVPAAGHFGHAVSRRVDGVRLQCARHALTIAVGHHGQVRTDDRPLGGAANVRHPSARRHDGHGDGRRTSRPAYGEDRRPGRAGRQERNACGLGRVLVTAANDYIAAAGSDSGTRRTTVETQKSLRMNSDNYFNHLVYHNVIKLLYLCLLNLYVPINTFFLSCSCFKCRVNHNKMC